MSNLKFVDKGLDLAYILQYYSARVFIARVLILFVYRDYRHWRHTKGHAPFKNDLYLPPFTLTLWLSVVSPVWCGWRPFLGSDRGPASDTAAPRILWESLQTTAGQSHKSIMKKFDNICPSAKQNATICKCILLFHFQNRDLHWRLQY